MAQSGQPPAPFTCSYSPNVPEFFHQAGCTLVVSTYQASKVIFLSAVSDEKLIQLPRNFERAMALGVGDGLLLVAEGSRVVQLTASTGLAKGYPRQPDTYETLYVPTAEYVTGPINAHGLEIARGKDGRREVLAVNTAFSCISRLTDTASFEPVWTPKNISALAPEDRCHLNGLAVAEGKPVYATAFNTGDAPRSWKEGLPGGGVVHHLESNEIVLHDLQMPHTPRIWDGKLYLLLSATGELVQADSERGSYEVVRRIAGFVRGMAKYGDFVFVAFSRLRQNSSIFAHLDISRENSRAGIEIIHLPTGAKVGRITYESSVDEIFDLQVIPGLRRAGIMNRENEYAGRYIATARGGFWVEPR